MLKYQYNINSNIFSEVWNMMDKFEYLHKLYLKHRRINSVICGMAGGVIGASIRFRDNLMIMIAVGILIIMLVIDYIFWRCSLCDHSLIIYKDRSINFCPICGGRIKKNEEYIDY